MISIRPVTAASGNPPAIPLAVTIRSGTTSNNSDANMAPVRANPVCISSAMKTTSLARHHSAKCRQEPIGRNDESALALDRFDDDRGQVGRPDLLVDHVDGAARSELAVHQLVVAVRIGQRRAIDLGRKRPETVLVRHALRGQRHREVRATVIGVIKRDNRLLLGVRAGDLHRIFHCLCPRVEQALRFSWSPGVRRLSCSATATYPSYGVIMKQVWVNCST